MVSDPTVLLGFQELRKIATKRRLSELDHRGNRPIGPMDLLIGFQ